MKRVLKILAQVLLAVGLMLMFSIWAPWLSSRPIAQLKEVTIPHGDIPQKAKSFTVNHGVIFFREIGTVAEEPVLFSLLSVLMVTDLVLLILSFPKGMRGRRKSKNSEHQS